jgi:pentapeptide repeat protein
VRAKASSLLIATAFLLSAESLFLACGRKHQSGQTTIPASAEPQKAWRWVDPNLKVRSRADLDEILKQHRFWLEFTRSEDFRESGEDRGDPPAELGEAILNGAELSRAILDEAQLNDAFLKGANLARANLDGADLTHADLSSANLSGAHLKRCVVA